MRNSESLKFIVIERIKNEPVIVLWLKGKFDIHDLRLFGSKFNRILKILCTVGTKAFHVESKSIIYT